MDLYGEELRVWKECWRDQEEGVIGRTGQEGEAAIAEDQKGFS